MLPNAWDVASAKRVAEAGFLAVATTSGGIGDSLGWPDGERIPPAEMFGAVARIAASVEVPVSADIEAGYGLAPEELASRLLEAGAVGCNLEDTDHARGGLVEADGQAERLAALKEAAGKLGVDLVVNARVDVFVRQLGKPAERIELALERARRYREAGADCVYPILATEEELSAFVARHPGPTNGMARPSAPRLSVLLEIGLARISFGSGLLRLGLADLGRRLAAIGEASDGWSEG